ncbi:DNA cytosine methyltransferase [Streptomyces sp. NPDC001356]
MTRRRSATPGASTIPGTAAAPPRPTIDDTIRATARPVPPVPGQQPLIDDEPFIASFCTGYGGLDMAVQEVLGGSLGWVSDVDPGACKILAHRYPHVPNIGDLTVADWQYLVDTFGRPYAVCGGYPCQPFSLAGELKGTDDERHLWPHIARALGVLRPRYAIFENVANHLRVGFDTVLCDLADLGFDVEWDVVRADEVRAPHQRRRLIVLATATDAPHLGHQRSGCSWGGRSGSADGGFSSADAPSDVRRLGNRDDVPARRNTDGRDTATGAGAVAAAADPDSGRRGPEQPDIRPGQSDPSRSGVEPTCGTCGCPESFHDAGGFCAGCNGCTDPELGRPSDAATHTEGVGRREGRAEPAWQQRRPDAALGSAPDWGEYAPAIARWEAATGRRAPWATDDRRRLSPEFVEWMMGLPAGHVTAVPGLTRTQQLKALGNGVVPQQAAAALRMLLARSRSTGRRAA